MTIESASPCTDLAGYTVYFCTNRSAGIALDPYGFPSFSEVCQGVSLDERGERMANRSESCIVGKHPLRWQMPRQEEAGIYSLMGVQG